MKKILSILVLGMIISALGIGTAAAITVDGMVSPGDEWASWYIHGADVNESTIIDNYDISHLYVWWNDTDVYIRTDVYGTPTLDNIDPSLISTKTTYQWTIDTSGDEVGDLALELKKAFYISPNTYWVDLYRLDTPTPTLLGTGSAVVNSIVECTFATNLVPSALEPASDQDVSMYLSLENAGGDEDDRLPNAGWVHTVPEPASMLLLGFGLIGLAGGKVRKRFTV